ncbi:MAG: DHA2 family efflux MFS transporter permease subunit [Solirubrobacteraceae bacterium]
MSRRPVILASLLLAAFAINLDITIVNVALPSLVRELRATTSELQWVVDAYSLVFAALILAAGSLSDRLGRKGFLLSGLAVFGLASIAGGFTSSADGLIVARCFMGVGAAMIFPATLSLISNVFTERGERARAIGLWGASAGAAIALGPIVGGWLLERFSWQSIFFVMAPVAAAGAALVAASVPTSRDPTAPRTDGPGLVLSTAAMASLIYTIIEAPAHGWGSARTLGGFGLAAGLFVAFIVRERSAAEPMLDLSLFSNPRFSAASGSVTVAFFSLAGFIFLITQYFQFIHGYGPFAAGVRTLPVAIAVAIASVLGTRLAVRLGTKLVVTTGLALLAVFFLWVSSATVTTTYLTIAITMVICGTGMGLTSAPATESIMGAVPVEKAGVGSAVNDATRLLGSTLGVAVIGSIYASVYSSRLTSTLPATLPAEVTHAAHQSIGAAFAAAAHLQSAGMPALGGAVHHAAAHAFTHGLSIGCLVAAGVSAVGAVAAGLLLPAQPPRPAADDSETHAGPETGSARTPRAVAAVD